MSSREGGSKVFEIFNIIRQSKGPTPVSVTKLTINEATSVHKSLKNFRITCMEDKEEYEVRVKRSSRINQISPRPLQETFIKSRKCPTEDPTNENITQGLDQ